MEYGLPLPDGNITDIAALTARNENRLHVFAINPGSGELHDISGGGIPVFETEPDKRKRPMGIGLYRRPADGAIFVLLSVNRAPRVLTSGSIASKQSQPTR